MPVRTWRRTTWTIVRSTLALGHHGLDDDPDNMSSDEVHKNSMCKDGRCPDTGKKLDNGGNTTQDNSKTDGTTQ
nr:Uncharacterised protein [Klebsiella pneumoniae]